MHWLTPLAILYGYQQEHGNNTLQRLLDASANPNGSGGPSPSCCACRVANFSAVLSLLEHAAQVEGSLSDVITPLGISIQPGEVEIALLLAHHGADLRLLVSLAQWGSSVFQHQEDMEKFNYFGRQFMEKFVWPEPERTELATLHVLEVDELPSQRHLSTHLVATIFTLAGHLKTFVKVIYC